MNYIVVGATAGLGRAITERLAKAGCGLVLVARDERDLAAQANHLKITFGVQVASVAADLQANDETINKIVEAAKSLPTIDGLFFPIGVSRTDDRGQLGASEIASLTEANLTGIIALVTKFLPQVMQSNKGVLVGFGSIAAARGRKSNIVYAACKRGLESYFESLRHLLASTNVKVHFYNMGYIDTSQTFGKKLPLPAVTAEAAAEDVVSHLNSDRGTVFYPGFWRLVTAVLKLVPWSIYKKMDF